MASKKLQKCLPIGFFLAGPAPEKKLMLEYRHGRRRGGRRGMPLLGTISPIFQKTRTHPKESKFSPNLYQKSRRIKKKLNQHSNERTVKRTIHGCLHCRHVWFTMICVICYVFVCSERVSIDVNGFECFERRNRFGFVQNTQKHNKSRRSFKFGQNSPILFVFFQTIKLVICP